jgi:queuine tRNA-ribosyltransferase
MFRSGEMLGPMLLSRHNLHYFQELMAGLRGAIETGTLEQFSTKFHADYHDGDIEEL